MDGLWKTIQVSFPAKDEEDAEGVLDAVCNTVCHEIQDERGEPTCERRDYVASMSSLEE